MEKFLLSPLKESIFYSNTKYEFDFTSLINLYESLTIPCRPGAVNGYTRETK